MTQRSRSAPRRGPWPPADLSPDHLADLANQVTDVFDGQIADVVHRARALAVLVSRLATDFESLMVATKLLLKDEMSAVDNGGDLFWAVIAETAIQDAVDVLDGLCARLKALTAGGPGDQETALQCLQQQISDHLREVGEPVLVGSAADANGSEEE